MGKARSDSRHKHSAVERQRFVELCRQSELTQARFAREHGLKLSALRQWLYRPNRRTPEPRPVFEEVLLSSPPLAGTWIAETQHTVGSDLYYVLS